MPGVQSRIDKDGSVYYDRKELLIYVLNLQDEALEKNPDSVFWMKKAIDGSHIYYINGRIVGRERPGVPEYSSEGEDEEGTDEEEFCPELDALVLGANQGCAKGVEACKDDKKDKQKRARDEIAAARQRKKKLTKLEKNVVSDEQGIHFRTGKDKSNATK